MDMYLDRILGTKTKINILFALVSNPEKSYVEKDLARECNASLSETNRQIKDLVNSGLIKMQRVAKVKVYQVNEKHFLFNSLQKLFKNLNSVYLELAKNLTDFITKKYRISSVILLGSLTKKAIRDDIVEEPSDVDLVFITENEKDKVKNDLLSYINTEIMAKYGVVVFPIVLSVEDYVKGLKDNPLVIEAQAKGEVIYGKKPRRFG
jgi:predicted transcriptional regulator